MPKADTDKEKASDYRDMVSHPGWRRLVEAMTKRMSEYRLPVNRANTAMPDWHLEAARNINLALGIEKVFREVEETLRSVNDTEQE